MNNEVAIDTIEYTRITNAITTSADNCKLAQVSSLSEDLVIGTDIIAVLDSNKKDLYELMDKYINHTEKLPVALTKLKDSIVLADETTANSIKSLEEIKK
ncbi:MAG: hypothetical protein U0K86_04340 [Agathobacter sp.]|nr:hypothetical protein [Agathobacter sp.]